MLNKITYKVNNLRAGKVQSKYNIIYSLLNHSMNLPQKWNSRTYTHTWSEQRKKEKAKRIFHLKLIFAFCFSIIYYLLFVKRLFLVLTSSFDKTHKKKRLRMLNVCALKLMKSGLEIGDAKLIFKKEKRKNKKPGARVDWKSSIII